MKEITVLLPIKVPDSLYCYNKDEDIWCRWFELGRCYRGFKPEIEGELNYKKPQGCLQLLWEETIR